jgi:hypothetical protein
MIGNPAPGDGGTDIVTVTSDVPNKSGTATMHYTTTNHAYAIRTGADGGTSLTFSIGRPTVGHRVDVTVAVGAATCSTSFMPR